MQSSGYDIAEHRDHLEIRGVSRDELAEALELVEPIRNLRAEHVEAVRGDLLQVLMSRYVSLIPPATVTQVQQLATHRAALLATPVLTHETLSELRGDKTVSSTRTWLARRRDVHGLFTVNYNGRTLIPAFQLDERGEPRAELQPILSALDEGGVRGWSLWTWLTRPTSFLSGGVPEEIARTDPERGLHAAQRFAAGPIA
jgi:hypothetical protein